MDFLHCLACIPGGEFFLVDLLGLITDIGLEFAIRQVRYNQLRDHLWNLLPIGFMCYACRPRPISVDFKVRMCTFLPPLLILLLLELLGASFVESLHLGYIHYL